MTKIAQDDNGFTQAGHTAHSHEANKADQHEAGTPDHNDEDDTLNLTKGPEEEETWLGHWPLLSALFILAVMLTLECGFKYQPLNVNYVYHP